MEGDKDESAEEIPTVGFFKLVRMYIYVCVYIYNFGCLFVVI